MKVYAVGCLQIDTNPEAKQTIKQQRLWHLFANFADAEKAVLENGGDMFERSYNYALIEEVYVIDPASKDEAFYVPKEWWYSASFETNNDQEGWPVTVVTKCEKPAPLDRVVCFWIG